MREDAKDIFLQLLETALTYHPDWCPDARQRLDRAQASRLLDIAAMAHMLSCSVEHLERLIASGELAEGRDFIDVSSKNSSRRMIRFIPDQVIKTLAKPPRPLPDFIQHLLP
jgi:hypothetical protein